MQDLFRRFASAASRVVGSAWIFIAAVVIVIGWGVTGPLFGFSNTWQLVINTGTTIITFLMVFLIQNTQNRDAQAMHLKLDELLRGVKGARTNLVNLEDLSDEELAKLKQQFANLHARTEKRDDQAKAAREASGRSATPPDTSAPPPAEHNRRRTHAKAS